MSDLFAAVTAINLLDHIAATTGGTPTHPGNRTTHVNPCPLCGHRDCFTYYMDTNSFKCWSCDTAGDIINLEKIRLGLESNLAAAKSLADQYGIDTDAPAAPIHTTPPKPITPPLGKGGTGGVSLLPDRAALLRNIMADYYHAQLLANPEALKYQTEVRGHTLDTLKRERVGWSPGTWTFSPVLKKHGFTDLDIAAIGLAAPHTDGKPGYYLTLGRGMYVYPHCDASGQVLHFTKKDPTKKSKAQPPKAGAAPDWLCFGQSAIDAPEFWLVEGENDRLTLLDHGVPNVAAIIGNTRVKEIIERVSTTCKGKTIYLAFDPDDAGRKYEAKFAAAIIAAGGTPKSIMESLTTWKGDIDDILRRAENPAGLLAEMTKNAVALLPPEPPAAGGGHPLDSPPPFVKGGQGGIFTFQDFHVLGEMADNSIAFWSMSDKKAKVYQVTIKNLSLDQLIQIGGREVAARVIPKRTEYSTDDQIIFSALKKELIMEASRTQLGKMQFLGQGIHLLNDKNLLLVNGKSGWVWTGTELMHHPYPLIERKFLEFEEGAEWVDVPALAEALRTMDRQKAFATLTQFLDILKQWTFEGKYDRLTTAGFVIAQIVQAAWAWRPHLWLAGGQGSGKSKLLELFKSIFGRYISIYEGKPTSEAGLRQVMTSEMRMTCIDEFENNKDRDKIIDLLRSCGRSGEAVKGSPTGKDPNSYRLRHMVMVCSIEIKLDRAAERSRFLICSTKKELGHATPIPPTSETCERLKINLTALALWGFREAMDLIRNLSVNKDYDTRMMEAIAVPYAMIAVCTDDPAASLRQNLNNYMEDWLKNDAGGIMEDEAALLQDILMAKIRLSVTQEDTVGTDHPRTISVDRTISQVLEMDPLPKEHHDSLQAHGVRVTKENALFVSAEMVRRELLKNTKWRELNILDILRRLPSARYCKLHLGGNGVNGVWIPEQTWKPEEDKE